MTIQVSDRFIDSLHEAFRAGDANVAGKREEAENVLLVERLFRAIAGGDFDSLAGLLADDVTLEITGAPGAPFAGTYRGRDSVIETARRNFSLVEDQRPEILSVVAQGEKLVVVGRESGRFRPTGRDYEVHWVHQYTFGGGKVTHIREVLDGASALSAAGPGE